MPGLFSNTGTSYKSYFVNKYIAELQEMKYAQRHFQRETSATHSANYTHSDLVCGAYIHTPI